MVNVSPPTVHKQCIRRRNGTDDYSIETAGPYRSFFRRPFGAPIPNLLTLNLERSAVSGSPDPAQACKSNAGGNSAPSRVPARPGTITLPTVTHYQAVSHWTMPPWQPSWPRSGYISLQPLGHITPPALQAFLFWLASQSCISQASPHLELKHTNHFQERSCTPETVNVEHTLVWPVWDHPGALSNGQSHKTVMLLFFQPNDDTSCSDSSLVLWSESSVPHGGTREGNLFYLPLTPYFSDEAQFCPLLQQQPLITDDKPSTYLRNT